MNILIPDSWLREFLTTTATPQDIQKCLSLCGPSIERLNKSSVQAFESEHRSRPPAPTRQSRSAVSNAERTDYVYDIEVTSNRVDCMSVIGIAREAAAILPQFGFPATLKIPPVNLPAAGAIPGLKLTNN